MPRRSSGSSTCDRITPPLRHFLLLLAGNFLLMIGPALAEIPVMEFHRAQMTISEADLPPPAGAGWQAVDLPHRPARNLKDANLHSYWFRTEFTLPDPGSDILWLYFPKLRSGGHIFINGQPISHVPGPNPQRQVRWFQPRLIAVSPALLREGRNDIAIHVRARESLTSLGPFAFGPEMPMRERYASNYFWESSTRVIATSLCAVAGMLAIIFWLRRRKEPLYEAFGLCALMWGARTIILFTPVVPLAWWSVWRAAYYFTTGGFIACMTLFLLRFTGFTSRPLNWFLLLWWIGGTAAFIIFGAPARVVLDTWWLLCFLPFTLFAVGQLYLFAARQRNVASIAMLVTITVALGLAMHDFCVQVGLFGLAENYLLHFGIPAFLMAMLWAMLDRFIASMEETESMSVRLAHLVGMREAELEAKYARIRQLEREQAAVEERQRIMQDMHDGVGSKLVSALTMVQHAAVERSEIVAVLRESLDEMRLAIDSLAPNEPDLLPTLANFRHRMEPRFRRAGLRLHWREEGLPEELNIGAHTGLHILRILQEAITNVLKHAHARNVFVTVRLEDGRLAFAVGDDGVGIAEGLVMTGRGMHNMKNRAEKIGATLEVGCRSALSREADADGDGPDGCEVRLTLCLQDS